MNAISPLVLLAVLLLSASINATAASLHIGAATTDITPDQPVALDGQRSVRISKNPETHIFASVLALESRDAESSPDHAVMVSCDLVAIREGITDMVRRKVGARAAGLDLKKLFLSATHTHTAPVTVEGRYSLPDDILQPAAYSEWLTTKIADAVVEAWQKRQPGKTAWGQSQAVIAQNRRPYYANGKAVMYGNPNSPEFRGIEGQEDHSVDVLFFWNAADTLIATAINVPCPSQQVEGGSAIHADFWDPVRAGLRKKHGEGLHVLAWTGAGGDVTSRLIVGKEADERMRKLRGGISRLDEMARRIVNAWEEAYEGAKNDIRSDVPLKHISREIDLPYRQVTILERAAAMTEAASYKDDPKQLWNYRWNQSVVDRFEAQKAGNQEPFKMELHTLRLGDVAIATNDFELYAAFGVQMKARSPGIQTFVIQLAGSGGYLPTEQAMKHGGYGAVIQSSRVGADGGQALVDRTIEAFKEMWQQP